MHIIRKIYHKLFGNTRPTSPVYGVQKQVATSTIIRNTNFLRFDVPPEERQYVKIGKRNLLTLHCVFESQAGYIAIGDNVQMNGVHLICREQITIENDVTMAWGITLYDHNSHSIYWKHRKRDNEQFYNDYKASGNAVVNKDWEHVKSAPITIHSKAWIGMNVLILKGVTIGEGAVIGAGSVVTKDVPAWTVAAGNPAQVVKEIPKKMQE